MTRKSATVLLEDTGRGGGSAHTVEQALRKVPGVSRAFVNPATEVAYVEYDAERCADADLVAAVESLGVRTLRPVARSRSAFVTPSARYSMPHTTHRSRTWWAFAGFLAIAGFFLITEHRAHLYGYWPFLFLLACPFLHMFGHSGHGGHSNQQRHSGREGHEAHRGHNSLTADRGRDTW